MGAVAAMLVGSARRWLQQDKGLLVVGLAVTAELAALILALKVDGVDGLDVDAVQALEEVFDFDLWQANRADRRVICAQRTNDCTLFVRGVVLNTSSVT